MGNVMAKPKLDYNDEAVLYSTDIAVTVNYLNYGLHVGYDSMLTLLQEARMRWLKQYDMTEVTLAPNVGYVISDAQVLYQSEAFHGDVLTVSFYWQVNNKKMFRLFYKVRNRAEDKTVLIAETGHVCFDLVARKTTSIPDGLLAVLRSIGTNLSY